MKKAASKGSFVGHGVVFFRKTRFFFPIQTFDKAGPP